MKYVAVIDESILCDHEKRNLIFIGKNKDGKGIRIDLKPLVTYVFVNKNGESVYLNQKHIDWLLECEQKESIERILKEHEEMFRGVANDREN